MSVAAHSSSVAASCAICAPNKKLHAAWLHGHSLLLLAYDVRLVAREVLGLPGRVSNTHPLHHPKLTVSWLSRRSPDRWKREMSILQRCSPVWLHRSLPSQLVECMLYKGVAFLAGRAHTVSA